MAENKTLTYVALGALAFIAVRKYQMYQGIQFGVAGVGFKFNPLQLIVKVSCNNPTGVSARLTNINGSVYQGSTYVAQVQYNSSQIIAPYNKTIIDLSIVPDALGTLQSLLQHRLPFQFRGSATVDGVPLPVRLDYQFGTTPPQS